jgi:hypothetical protein
MNEDCKFELALELPMSTPRNAIDAQESLARMLKQDSSVRVLGSSMRASPVSGASASPETRGLELVGLLIGVVSSGAATKLIQALAACFKDPRIASGGIKLRDEKRGKTLEMELKNLDKEQIDAMIAATRAFFLESGVPT